MKFVLVHEYVPVNDAVVLALSADPSDLDQFVAAVIEWIAPATERRPALAN